MLLLCLWQLLCFFFVYFKPLFWQLFQYNSSLLLIKKKKKKNLIGPSSVVFDHSILFEFVLYVVHKPFDSSSFL